jgi:TonB family protein
MKGRKTIQSLLALIAWAGCVAAQTAPVRPQPRPFPEAGGVFTSEPARITLEHRGSYPTREGLRLRLTADVGSVRVKTEPGLQEARFVVRVETDPRQPDAARLLRQLQFAGAAVADGVQMVSSVPWGQFRGRLWVTFELTVPRKYGLEIQTNAGNITTEDVEGRVWLVSNGGNISAGNVQGSARLETQGGHVTVQDVSGELVALTAGGHVAAGNVGGSATLRSGGGHVRLASVGGVGQVETGGGDIAVQKTGARIGAVSYGGQITFGEAQGAIEAKTAGGGIRVLKVAGPMQLQTASGSIVLAQIRDAVQASTASGNITAWFVGEGKKRSPSQLESTQGDIVVYLPRQLGLNIEATIASGANFRVMADPTITMKYAPAAKVAAGPRVIRAVGVVNGGGETLRLRTTEGNIRLVVVDQNGPLDAQFHLLRWQEGLHLQERQARELLKRELSSEERRAQAAAQVQRSRIEVIRAMVEEYFARPLRVDPNEQQKKLVYSEQVLFPSRAREAKVQGRVELQLLIAKDGNVESAEIISGDTLLREAARAGVMRWRYEPTVMKGRAMKVITRVAIDFQLK